MIEPVSAPPFDAGSKAKTILSGPAYVFCHDPTYPWTDAEARWCSVVGDRNEKCEALPRACHGEMTHAIAGGRWRRGRAGSREPNEPIVLHLPNVGPVRVVLWVALAIAVVLVLRAVCSRAFGRRLARETSAGRAGPPPVGAAPKKSTVEIDVQRLLDRARRAAAEGRFGAGIADVYAALLRQLEGERLLRIDAWRTNGDYLRDLRGRPDIRAAVAPVVRAVEGIQFGRETPTGERFESVYAEVTAILEASRSRTARAGLGPALAIGCLALALASCGDFFSSVSEEDSPSGTSAVVELLRQAGIESTVRFRTLSKNIDATEVVLLPGAKLDNGAWNNLLDWVEKGGTLVVANRDAWLKQWPGVSFSERPGLTPELALSDKSGVAMRGASIVVPGTNELTIPKEADRWRPVLERDGGVYAAAFPHEDGSLVVLADGQLFTNASIAMADNGAFLIALLANRKKVELVGELMGGGASSPLSSVERGKLAPVLLQLGFALALFFLYKGIAFGTLVDPPSAKRRSFAEHARALGLLYAKAGASDHARSIFGIYALERLRERMPLRDQKGLSALADAVAARSGQPLGKVTMMLIQADEPRSSDAKEVESPEDLDLIRSLTRALRQSKGIAK